jgi:hypothetical protein
MEVIQLPSIESTFAADIQSLVSSLQENGSNVKTILNKEEDGSQTIQFVTPEQLLSIVRLCPNLISIQNLSTTSINIGTMGELRTSCVFLEELSVQHNGTSVFDPMPLFALVTGGNAVLKHLRLPSMNKKLKQYQTFLACCPNLLTLHFDEDTSGGFPARLDWNDIDPIFSTLSERCSLLHTVSLPADCAIHDSTFMSLLNSRTNFLSLSIGNCTRLTSTALEVIADCAGLEVLCLEQCGDIRNDGISFIAKRCSKLRKFTMHNAMRITDDAICVLVSNCGAITDMDLSHCTKLTSMALHAIVAGCAGLVKLNITGCSNIFEADIVEVTKKYPLLELIR